MNMVHPSTIRYRWLRRHRAARSSTRWMRFLVLASYPSRTRQGAVESPACPDCIVSEIAYGFRLVCGTNRRPRSIHRVTHSGGLNLSLSPALLRHRFGPIRRPGGTAPLCFPDSSPKASLGPCSRKRILALGAGPCARLRPVCPEQIRRSNTEEIIMYRNQVSLIGFTGKDAEARTTNTQQKPYTALSVATQSSYKDKNTGEYINRTEWHRVIVWGKLGEFARKTQEGRASGRRRCDCQPRVRRQEAPGCKAPDR